MRYFAMSKLLRNLVHKKKKQAVINSCWLIFSKNIYHWSKFIAFLDDIFFSRTFDLLFINSNRCLLVEV